MAKNTTDGNLPSESAEPSSPPQEPVELSLPPLEPVEPLAHQDMQKQEGFQQTIVELTDLLKRTQANFENYRKQNERRMLEMQEMAAREVILQLLPIVDTLEMALKSTSDPKNASVSASPPASPPAPPHQGELRKGMELLYQQLQQLLADQGVTVIEASGKLFDPYQHEAILKEHSLQPVQIILEEYQKGYLLHRKVLRHARVKVSAGPLKEGDGNKDEK